MIFSSNDNMPSCGQKVHSFWDRYSGKPVAGLKKQINGQRKNL